MHDIIAVMQEYTSPQAMKKLSFDFSRFETPTTKATWSGVEVADYFKKYFEIADSGAFGYSSWLRRIKKENVNKYQAEKLIEIMLGVEKWLKTSEGEDLERGKWMFNRFRYEIKQKGIDKYISSKS